MVENDLKMGRKSWFKALAGGIVAAAALLNLRNIPKATAGTYLELGQASATNDAGANPTGMTSSNGDHTMWIGNSGSGDALRVQGNTGTSLTAWSGTGNGWAFQAFGSAYNTQFANKAPFSASPPVDKTTLIQLVTGDASPKTWNMAVGGAANGLGLTSGQFYLESGSGAKMIIDTSGRVGLSTSPSARFHVLDPAALSCNFQAAGGDVNINWFKTAATNFSTFGFFTGSPATPTRQYYLSHYNDNTLRISRNSTGNDFVLNNSGNVGIGTASPTQKLHVVGTVRATGGFITGDITFANGLKATEEGTGLAFLNDAGEKIAVLDRQGNFRVKGKITEDPTL